MEESQKVSGLDNEFHFVQYFNNKKIKDLDPIGQEFINALYPEVDEAREIKCWKNHYPQKTDIFLKVGGLMRGISIKVGAKNSVHVEPLTNFVNFLKQSGVSKEIIESYLSYHFADGTITGKGTRRLSVEEYKKNHQESIDEINKIFNKDRMISRAIERFVLRGNNSEYPIDALIYGIPEDYFWITRKDISNIFSFNKNRSSSAVHFGKLTVQPKNRCLNYNPRYEKDRYCIQIKWYSLFDDILEYLQTKYQD